MKTEESLRRSVQARIDDVEALALLVANCANDLRDKFDGKTMNEMRGYSHRLTQSIHEYNAYYNTLHTS